ncbi:MAG: DMT family transporter [Proteobacteria bacterium]|nr:MAG: DMT family transporter [Pseudomonadota bacterium]
MSSALWGALCALNLGVADFLARFSTRAVGSLCAFFGVLLISTVAMSAWALVNSPLLVWDTSRIWLLGLNGVATTVMTLLLYQGLARGPIGVVAPVVASHPVLVVLFWVIMGARPSTIQWFAMSMITVGVVIVSRSGKVAVSGDCPDSRALRRTLWIATGASIAYAVLVVAGQSAVPIYGEFQTMWFGRLASFSTLLLVFLVRRERPAVPARLWPLLGIQGTLDVLGYLFLFAGSRGDGAGIAAVTASTFGAVTVLLARIVLREPVSAWQWFGILMVFVGVAVVSGFS